MCLRSIEVENYRAIARGSVTFDDTTVLFGENDSGRSSIIEAMLLVLGGPGERLEDRLQPFHFHRAPGREAGPLHIRLRIAEPSPGQWPLPKRLAREFPAPSNAPREFLFDFQCTLDPLRGEIISGHSIVSPVRPGFVSTGDAETCEWLRGLAPALWLQPESLTGAGDGGDRDWAHSGDPDLDVLAEHRRRLLAGNTPDLQAELGIGARAAQALLVRHGGVFAGAGPLMSAMAADILERRTQSAAGEGPQLPTIAHKLAVLLLLGAMIRLVRRTAPAHAHPILIVENPESNLHPMTLACVWRIVERILWQKVITTNSGTILANAPLNSIRRLTRAGGQISEWAVHPKALSKEAVRRVSYHLRSRRASAMFARCWVLVEGETEFWVLPELARICGYDFAAEGVACVEFAQCGLAPLLKLADQLGIACHVFVDGDAAGQHYAQTAATVKSVRSAQPRPVTILKERDIENCFWHNGFADVIRRIAYPNSTSSAGSPAAVIKKAIERTSKPFLALSLIDAAAQKGARSIPPVLRGVIDSAVQLSRRPAFHRIR